MNSPLKIPAPETLLAEAATSEQALMTFIKALINRAAEKRCADPGDHPLIMVNDLKNLLSDRRTDPPLALLTWALERVNSFETSSLDPTRLETIRKQGSSGVLFISDVEDALFSGDSDAMVTAVGQWFLATAAPESLLEVFTQTLVPGGPGWPALLYAAQRTAAFGQSGEILWKILLAIIDTVPDEGITSERPAMPSDSPETLLEPILRTGRGDLVIRLAAVWRLWDLETPRQARIRQALAQEITALQADAEENVLIGDLNKKSTVSSQSIDYLDLILTELD